jgi:hypothetical protein
MRVIIRSVAATIVAAGLAAGVAGQAPKFYSDDPLQREPETQDASKVQPWEIPLTPDLITNLFGTPGDPVLGQRAGNINTADEVPDSSWFTNRIYARPVSTDEISKGPNTMDGPSGRWTIIRAKSAGVAPGFTVRDEKGETWFVAFDGKDNPVAPTAAAMVATKLFHTLGYNQVETYLTTIQPADISIDPQATVREHGGRRVIVQKDIDEVLDRAARSADGSYRAIAGRALPGKPLGGFKYFGTRPDDPNDIVPHEHRRELRALQVFGAWTNLVDMKAGNTLDTLVTENGRGIVRHYLQDVGSTFGTGALYPRDGDEGYEHLVDMSPMWKRIVTFGLFTQPWQTVDYEEHPEIGRFEGELFDPEAWKPRVPVAALRHARPDDTLWAALRVMAFTDEHIRAAVKAGGFTDPAAGELLARVLGQRRDKIGRVYFSRINPLTRFALSDSGELTFENPAVKAGFDGEPAKGYEAAWARFDNASQTATPISTSTGPGSSVRASGTLPAEPGGYLKVSVRALESTHSAWTQPVDVYFRREGSSWKLVGVERMK